MSASPGSALLKAAGWLTAILLPCAGIGIIVAELFFSPAPQRVEAPVNAAQVSESPSPETPSPTPQATAPQLPAIVIDPGHGGNDDGAKSQGLKEKNLTLDIARRVNRLLMKAGYSTVMTRNDDVYISLADRVAIADASPESLFISIHFNQSGYSYVDGVETYFANAKDTAPRGWSWLRILNLFSTPKPVDKGERFANCLQTALVEKMNAPDRRARSRDLYVVHHTKQPAILVEPGFISNPAEAARLKDANYRERLAAAIVSGIASYVHGDDPQTIQMVRK